MDLERRSGIRAMLLTYASADARSVIRTLLAGPAEHDRRESPGKRLRDTHELMRRPAGEIRLSPRHREAKPKRAVVLDHIRRLVADATDGLRPEFAKDDRVN